MTCGLLALIALEVCRAEGQETAPEPALPDLATKRQEVRERIDVARRKLEEQQSSETPAAAATDRAAREVEILTQRNSVLARQESAIARGEELAKARAEVEQQMATLRDEGTLEERPFSFLLLEQLRDALAYEKARSATQEASVADARKALELAQATSEARHKERRRLHEESGGEKDAVASPSLELARQECELADETVTLREQERDNEVHVLERQQQHVVLLEEKIKLVEQDVRFSKADLSDVLAQLDKQRDDLTHIQPLLEMRASHIEGEWAESDIGSAPPSALQDAESSARLAAGDNVDRQLRMIARQLERLPRMREVWKQRYQLANQRLDLQTYTTWREAAEEIIEQTISNISLQERQLDDLRQKLADLDERIKSAADEAVAQWLRDERRQRAESIDALSGDVAHMKAYQQLHKKLIAQIDAETTSFSFGEWIDYGSNRIRAVWGHELFTTDDGNNGITVGQVCKGLLLLGLGLVFSRRLSALIGDRMLPRLGMNEGGAAALQSLMFYGLLVTCSLTALHMVNVPLTMFTFLGGAFAIALGFGSQKILNNFVSGLILIIEQPIRTGDLVEIDGVSGIVENIGMRSTRVCTATNVEIIVPNSSFLESNVVNWTLSDVMIRACVPIGVAYGSATREVARQLKRAADEHGLVLGKPEPFVWFTEFGDNALHFELHFYLNMRNLSERKRVESDLRFMIDQYFKDAGIVIAFPQRDVHVNTPKAIDVRLLSPTIQAEFARADDAKAA
jgi:small-conductance mechanosensitive channel